VGDSPRLSGTVEETVGVSLSPSSGAVTGPSGSVLVAAWAGVARGVAESRSLVELGPCPATLPFTCALPCFGACEPVVGDDDEAIGTAGCLLAGRWG
jgi:hypothetical protein